MAPTIKQIVITSGIPYFSVGLTPAIVQNAPVEMAAPKLNNCCENTLPPQMKVGVRDTSIAATYNKQNLRFGKVSWWPRIIINFSLLVRCWLGTREILIAP